jgi:hypothetical protein
MANSSEDGHATATLQAELKHDLEMVELKDYRDLCGMFKQRMTEWADGYGTRTPPAMQFILGAKIGRIEPKLFFCEPPNTVREIDDYIAAGSGGCVTDPLYATFFGNNGGDHTDVQIILRRVAYLIYRAKKDDVYCGKRTDCIVIGQDIFEVEQDDMLAAERVSADLDFLASGAALFATGSDDLHIERDALDLADMLKGSSLRKIEFRDHRGRRIGLQ